MDSITDFEPDLIRAVQLNVSLRSSQIFGADAQAGVGECFVCWRAVVSRNSSYLWCNGTCIRTEPFQYGTFSSVQGCAQVTLGNLCGYIPTRRAATQKARLFSVHERTCP